MYRQTHMHASPSADLSHIQHMYRHHLQAGVLCEVAAAAGRHLTSLRADGCSVSDAVLGALGTHCGGLGTLSLVGCRGVTDAGLAAVASGCPRCANAFSHVLMLLWAAAASMKQGWRQMQPATPAA
jgi:hypothetical protein